MTHKHVTYLGGNAQAVLCEQILVKHSAELHRLKNFFLKMQKKYIGFGPNVINCFS